MSSLTKLAALRMQLGELERTPCARCGHNLRAHTLTLNGAGCRAHIVSQAISNGTVPQCKCVEFADSLDEQLSLDPPKAKK